MSQPSQTDLAWAAGIVDGEGCIILVKHTSGNRKTETWLLRADVGNCDPRMLVKLKSMFGGCIVKKREADHYKPQWRWIVYGKNAASALTLMLPYLVSKKDQAELALLSRQFLRKKCEVSQEKILKMREIGEQLSAMKRRHYSLDLETHVIH